MVAYTQCLIARERSDAFASRTQMLRIAVSQDQVALWLRVAGGSE